MSLTTNPIYPKVTNQNTFLGRVESAFENNVNNNQPRTNQIKFSILGLPDFVDEYPVATLLGNNTKPVVAGDLVMIWDVCTVASGLHTFFYFPINEERFTGIKNYNNEIDVTNKNYAHIKLPNMEITLDRHSDNSKGEDQDDLSDGKGLVEININNACTLTFNCNTQATTISCSGAVKLLGGTGQSIMINSIEGNAGFCMIPVCPFTGATHTTGVVPTK